MIKTKKDLIQEWREYYDISPEEETDEEIWEEKTNLPNLYGSLDEDNGEWYHIINVKLKETYGYWFIDEPALKRYANHAHQETTNVSDIMHQITRRIHSGIKKDIKILEIIDKTKESWIGQNNY